MLEDSKVLEWQNMRGGSLDIPESITRKMRYKVVYQVGQTTQSGYCGGVNYERTRLRNVLIDTSDRHNGITLCKRMTFYPWLELYNGTVMLLPLDRPSWLRRLAGLFIKRSGPAQAQKPETEGDSQKTNDFNGLGDVINPGPNFPEEEFIRLSWSRKISRWLVIKAAAAGAGLGVATSALVAWAWVEDEAIIVMTAASVVIFAISLVYEFRSGHDRELEDLYDDEARD